MDVSAQTDERLAAQKRRRPPGAVAETDVSFDGNGIVPDQDQVGTESISLTLYVTNEHGDTAQWFDDFWWTELIRRFGNKPITVQIAPTPDALLHPVVIHQIEMLFRVAPSWRIVGYAYRDDFSTPPLVEAAAISAYSEIRIIDQIRSEAESLGRATLASSIEELFGCIRRAQVKVGATRPILVRLPASAARSFEPKSNPESPKPSSPTADQTSVSPI